MPIIDDPGDVILNADREKDGIGSVVLATQGMPRLTIGHDGSWSAPIGNVAPPPSGDVTGATDAAALLALLAAQTVNHRRITLQSGIYYVNQQLTITTDGAALVGQSKTRTQIVATAAMNAVLSVQGCLEVHLADFTLNGGGLANHELDLEHAEGTTRHHVERVRCDANCAAWVNNTNGDGTIASGQPSFSSATGVFASTDVGKWILVNGAAAGGVNLFAQIVSVQSPTAVTLDRNAGTSVATAGYSYGGFSIHNVGCEDTTFSKCEVQGSEASPATLPPAVLYSCPNGLGSVYGCDWFGPVFWNALTLKISGSNIGALVSVNQTGAQSNQVLLDGCWLFDGGAPTFFSPIDSATTYLATITLLGCHLVCATAAQWCNGRLPSGNGIRLADCVFVQSAGNTNTIMGLFATSTGTSNTRLLVDGGKLSIGGSMTNLRLNSGGSSSHTVELRGRIDGVGTYSNVGTVATSPAIPASGAAQTNNWMAPACVYVNGGTVTGIAIDGVATGLTSGMFLVRPMGTITLTYSAAPTWVWQAL